MYKNDQKNDPKVPKKKQKKPYYHGPTPPTLRLLHFFKINNHHIKDLPFFWKSFLRQSDCQTVRLSEFKAVRMSYFKTFRLSDFQTVRLPDCQTSRLSDSHIVRHCKILQTFRVSQKWSVRLKA